MIMNVSNGGTPDNRDGDTGRAALMTLAPTLALLETPALLSEGAEQPFGGAILYANPALGRLIGRHTAALSGRPLESLLTPDFATTSKDYLLATLRSAGRATSAGTLNRTDGGTLSVEWQITAVPDSGPGRGTPEGGRSARLWLSVLQVMAPDSGVRPPRSTPGDRSFRTLGDIGLFPLVIARLADGVCINVNDPARGYFGLPELPAAPPTLDKLLLPAGEWERIRTLIVQGHTVSGREVRIAARSGAEVWALISVAQIPSEDTRETGAVVVLTFHDITRLKATEETLRQREAHVRQFFNEMVSAFALHRLLCDEEGRPVDYVFLDVNPAFEVMTGLGRPTVIGRRVREILPDLDMFWIETYGKVALTGIPVHFERYDPCLGRHFEVSAFSPRRGEFAVTFMDISGRKAFEQAMVAAKDAAEQANRAKSQFLATMSHELRTPLISIIGFSELVRDEVAAGIGHPGHADYAGEIISSGQHLLALINDILDYSKIESGKMAIDPQWLDGADALRRCVGLMWERARSRQVTLQAVVPAGRLWLWADHKALRHIALNLLANAITFTLAEGRVEIRLETTREGYGRITVADTGVGIPEEHLSRILQPFEQGDNRYGRSEGGTGLGLALVKGLVDLHGGTLEICSVVDQGTTVTVTLPAPAGAAATSDGHAWPSQPPFGGSESLAS